MRVDVPVGAPQRRCPDDGRCWHGCGEGACWRVSNCGPLSGVYPNDDWPEQLLSPLWIEID